MVRIRKPPLVAALLTLLTVLSAGSAAAYHEDLTDHYYGPSLEPCVSLADDVDADCTLEGDGHLVVPADPLEGESVELMVDARDAPRAAPPAGDPATRDEIASTLLAPAVSTRETTDPLLLTASNVERWAKTTGFDKAEYTGYHFRLVCGWDLPTTRPACDVHDPERDSSLAYVRALRDTAVHASVDTARSGTTDAVRDTAPGVHARLAVGTLHVEVAGPPGTAAPAPQTTTDVPRVHLGPRLASPAGLDATVGPDGPRPAPYHAPPEDDPGSAPPAGSNPLLAQAAPAVPPSEPARLALLAVAGAGALVLLAVLAYRHLERRSILRNETRRTIYDLVGREPGTTIADAARAADVAHETARYHLNVLQEHGIVVTERVGNRVHHFRTDEPWTRRERLLAALDASGFARDVYEAIAEGGRTLADLHQDLDLSKSGIHWHLQRMEDLGLVEREATGSSTTYRAALE